VRGNGAAWRGLAAFVFAACGGALGLGGEGSLRAARTLEAWSTGHSAPAAYSCAFRRETGLPCPGCGGTEAFGLAAHGFWRRSALANPLGAFAGLAAWLLGLASALTLVGAGTVWLRAGGALVLALLPAAFVVNAVVWWMSLPPGALGP